MDLSTDPSGPPLDLEKEEDTFDTKLRTVFKKTVNKQKILVSHLHLVINLIYYSPRSGINRSYRSEVGLRSASWIIESN